jgi:hypothetical protein
MEFFMLVGVLLFVFIMFYAISFEQMQAKNYEKGIILGEDIANKVQREILLATSVSEGYYREFKLPSTAEGLNYSVIVKGGEVAVIMPQNEIVRIIPEVVGNISKDLNIIRKQDGVVYLN